MVDLAVEHPHRHIVRRIVSRSLARHYPNERVQSGREQIAADRAILGPTGAQHRT
jgi:hypothetical protein